MKMDTSWLAALFGLLLLTTPTRSDDWPQWRGPQRDGTSKETGLLKEWPTNKPPLIWMTPDLGKGYSSLAVVGDRIYTLGNDEAENEFLQAHAIPLGKRLWQTPLGKV